MAEPLPPVLVREPVVDREALRLTAPWVRWLEGLLRRQTEVQAQIAALEARVTALENP